MPDILDYAFGRYAFAALLEKEFHIHINPDDREQAKEALHCLQMFDGWQDFYEATGWERDNPQESTVRYLTENRICRIVGQQVWYFSRLEWEKR